MSNPDNLSTPAPLKAPRALTAAELATAHVVADALIPATATAASASAEPAFDSALATALNARADAFDAITGWLADVAGLDGSALFDRLHDLHDTEPDAFQALSAVLAGAWLLTPTVRARIGYRGQGRNPASLTEAVDQLEDGILDAVLDRGAFYVPTPDGATAQPTWADLHPRTRQGAVRVSTEPAYQVTKGGALDVDTAMYARIAEADRTTLESFIIPIRTGKAWTVPAGHLCRITVVEGPQVGDLNVWNAHNPRERMWAAKTRQLQAAHVRMYDRLWSNLPYLRPLVTLVGDSLADYGVDDDGGRVHDLLGSRCDPYTNQLLSGERFDFHCHSNLTRAVLPHGLNESDVHDVLNVFQVTGLNGDDKYYNKACPAKKGDYFEFFAEIDVLCALSTCPGGDLSIPQYGPDARDQLEVCRPLGIEVFKPDPASLEGWIPPEPPLYKGFHGLKIPQWGQD